MPRGRAGLQMIPAEAVRASRQRVGDRWQRVTPQWAADFFKVTLRTWYRWERTGLPLYYGRQNISRQKWDQFLTAVDRKLSPRRRSDRLPGPP